MTQTAVRDWWNRNPMSYDVGDPIAAAPDTQEWFRELDRRDVLEVHRRRMQAGMTQLLANDMDRDTFHRQLGSTGVA